MMPIRVCYSAFHQTAKHPGKKFEDLVMKTRGLLAIDDTTLDKPYADKVAMFTGHHAVVSGINPFHFFGQIVRPIYLVTFDFTIRAKML